MQSLDLIGETLAHFDEGARSVRAYTTDNAFIITRDGSSGFWVTDENEGYSKKYCDNLESYFKDVFGIEARY